MRRTSERGFTLIEVVVALAILGVGLIVIIELFSGGLRLGRTSAEYTQAIGYARLKMEDITLARQLTEGIEEGEFDKNFRWQLEVKKVEVLPLEEAADIGLPIELYRIKMNVLWKSGSQERSAVIESLKVIKPPDHEAKT
ncbi:MAG: type II secretion system protein [Pseudomonadota bacterium]